MFVDISHTLNRPLQENSCESESDNQNINNKKWFKKVDREYNKDICKLKNILHRVISNDRSDFSEYDNSSDIYDYEEGYLPMPKNPNILMKQCKKLQRKLIPLKCKWNITKKNHENAEMEIVYKYVSFGNYLTWLESDVEYMFLYYQNDKYREICQQFRNSNLYELESVVQNLERDHNKLIEKFRLHIKHSNLVETTNGKQYFYFYEGYNISKEIYNFLKCIRNTDNMTRRFLKEYFMILEKHRKWLNDVNIYWNDS
jgi:hypothetical protein